MDGRVPACALPALCAPSLYPPMHVICVICTELLLDSFTLERLQPRREELGPCFQAAGGSGGSQTWGRLWSLALDCWPQLSLFRVSPMHPQDSQCDSHLGGNRSALSLIGLYLLAKYLLLTQFHN